MKILLTGATGFIGRKLTKTLFKEGHDLVILGRNVEKIKALSEHPCQAYAWNPLSGLPPREALHAVDAVINLAGEPVVGERWTAGQKKKIYDSRVLGTRNLIQGLLASPDSKARVWISASAIGYYGNRGDEILTEEAQAGKNFLAEVCQAWEAETFRAVELGCRTLAVRIGIVLGRGGGALDKIVPVFKKGVGGPVGSGEQWMSWIHVSDLVSLFSHLLQTEGVEGIEGSVNGVAPRAVKNEEFSKTLALVLKKPCAMRAPAFALKLMMGEAAQVVLGGQHVLPKRALAAGFKFRFETISAALEEILSIEDLSAREPKDEEFHAEQWIAKPVEEVFEFFSNEKNLETLTPPWLGFHVVDKSTEKLSSGTLINYQLKIHGIPFKWQSQIDEWEENKKFVDTQMHGPYTKWHHTHTFESVRGGTLVTDHVLYQVPAGTLGKSILGGKIRHDVEKIFDFRRSKIREIFGNG